MTTIPACELTDSPCPSTIISAVRGARLARASAHDELPVAITPAYADKETTRSLRDARLEEEIGAETFPSGSPALILAVTENKATVEQYMEGFRNSDHALILSCLTDDVVWDIPGAFHIVGKDAFDREIENEAFVGRPAITVTRMTEEKDVVVAEGTVRVQRKGGDVVNLVFCDVFVMQRGKIRQLISYLVPTDGARSL